MQNYHSVIKATPWLYFGNSSFLNWALPSYKFTKFNAMNIHVHAYELIYPVLSLLTNILCLALILSQLGTLRAKQFTNTVNAQIYRRNNSILLRSYFSRLYFLLQCLHTLAILNQHCYSQPPVFALSLKYVSFLRKHLNKITKVSHLHSSFLKNHPFYFLAASLAHHAQQQKEDTHSSEGCIQLSKASSIS